MVEEFNAAETFCRKIAELPDENETHTVIRVGIGPHIDDTKKNRTNHKRRSLFYEK